MVRSCTRFRQIFAIALSFSLVPLAPAAQVGGAASVLQLVTMKGEGESFNLRHATPIDLEVQVLDPQGNPRRRAIVTFVLLPSGGATAYFVNSAQTVTVQTDDNGIATVRLVRPNGIAGAFTVRVSASDGNLQGSTEIHLNNFRTVAATPPGKWVLIGGIFAGGLLAGILANRGNDNSQPSQPPLTTITAGPARVN